MRTRVEAEPSPAARRARRGSVARTVGFVAVSAILLTAGLAALRTGLPSTRPSALELDLEGMQRALDWIELRVARARWPTTLAFTVERGHHPDWKETPGPVWAEPGVAGPPEIFDSRGRGLFVCAIRSTDGYDLFCASSGPNGRFDSPAPYRGARKDDLVLRRSVRPGKTRIK